VEKELIDSLHLTLNECENLLDIDYQLLTVRLEKIHEITSFFKNEYKEEISLEIGNKLDKLRTIRKIYSNAVSKGPESQGELLALRNQLKDLEKSLRGITKNQFREYYNNEKVYIFELYDVSSDINQNVYGAEGEYYRLESFFEKYLSE
jgi:hypothetical protein